MLIKCAVCGRAFEHSTPCPDLLIEGRENGKSAIALLNFMKANCCSDLCLKQWWEAANECYNEWQTPPTETEERQS